MDVYSLIEPLLFALSVILPIATGPILFAFYWSVHAKIPGSEGVRLIRFLVRSGGRRILEGITRWRPSHADTASRHHSARG